MLPLTTGTCHHDSDDMCMTLATHVFNITAMSLDVTAVLPE